MEGAVSRQDIFDLHCFRLCDVLSFPIYMHGRLGVACEFWYSAYIELLIGSALEDSA
jgi:hypothetical protein